MITYNYKIIFNKYILYLRGLPTAYYITLILLVKGTRN